MGFLIFLKREPIFFLGQYGLSKPALFEGGRWVWPGIREGFARTLHLPGREALNVTLRTPVFLGSYGLGLRF